MDIANKIYSTYLNNSYVSENIGASYIGHECERYIYYTWKNILPVNDGRVLKIFETGNIQEDIIISRIKQNGFNIYHQQKRLVDNEINNLTGKIDGILDYNNKEYILEVKTFNDKRFKDLLKNGVILSNSLHYAQMIMYMGWTEIMQSLYVAINKNDETIYTEIVNFDILLFHALRSKAKKIIESKEIPKGISDKKTFFKCKMCHFNKVCFK